MNNLHIMQANYRDRAAQLAKNEYTDFRVNTL